MDNKRIWENRTVKLLRIAIDNELDELGTLRKRWIIHHISLQYSDFVLN